MKKFFITTFLLLYFLSIPFSANAQEYNENSIDEEPQFQLSVNDSRNLTTRKYLLGPNDILSINVQGVSDLNQEDVRIQPDGCIKVNSLGSIKAAGFTIDQLTYMIEEKYCYYLKNPKISINLMETRPFVVYVTGAVSNPGSYEMSTDPENNRYSINSKPGIKIERNTPLLTNVLLAAGGVCHYADIENIKVTNKIDHSTFKVDLLKLLKNGDSSQDIYLMTGDTVEVPSLPTPLAVDEEKYKLMSNATFFQPSIPVKVYGYVRNPGLIELDPTLTIDLSSAIVMAGGYPGDSAYAPKEIFISRTDISGKLVTKSVNPRSNDVTLMPNDIVYVPERKGASFLKAFDRFFRIINPVNTVAGSYNNWALMFDPTRFD